MLHNEERDDTHGDGDRREPHGDPLDGATLPDGRADGPRLVPESSSQERLAAVAAAQNPLLEAAQPLLRALADMPAQLSDEGVAEEINQVSGSVKVTGHSDNQPIRTREFPNNQVLSEKRAAAVAAALQGAGVVASRLQIEGRGDTMPISDSATAAGRARNRRVDIVVTQGDGSTAGSLVPQAATAATAVTGATRR